MLSYYNGVRAIMLELALRLVRSKYMNRPHSGESWISESFFRTVIIEYIFSYSHFG